MLTQKDIQKIVKANKSVFITKEELQKDILSVKENMQSSDQKILKEIFSVKEEMESFKEVILEEFSNLQSSVDAYAKKADTYFQEMVMLSHKVDRHEKWLLAMADKLGMKLEY